MESDLDGGNFAICITKQTSIGLSMTTSHVDRGVSLPLEKSVVIRCDFAHMATETSNFETEEKFCHRV